MLLIIYMRKLQTPQPYGYVKKKKRRNYPLKRGETTQGRNDSGRNDPGRNDPRAKRLTGETTHGRNDLVPLGWGGGVRMDVNEELN